MRPSVRPPVEGGRGGDPVPPRGVYTDGLGVIAQGTGEGGEREEGRRKRSGKAQKKRTQHSGVFLS